MDEKESRWLWPGWLPLGHLSMISGPPGAQTATVAAWLATALQGGLLPDGAPIAPDNRRQVVWIPTKGRIDELVDRFKILGTPLDRVIRPVKPDDESATVDLTDQAWLETIVDLVTEERPAWVIVDGIPPCGSEVIAAVHHFFDAMGGGNAGDRLRNDDFVRAQGCQRWLRRAEQDSDGVVHLTLGAQLKRPAFGCNADHRGAATTDQAANRERHPACGSHAWYTT